MGFFLIYQFQRNLGQHPWYAPDPLTAFDNFFGNRDRYGNPLCRGEETATGILNQAMNFTRSGASASNGCVALWQYGGAFTHGSVTKPGNDQPHGYDWESKPGGLMRSFHPRNALSGSSYGSISHYYRWDGTWTYGTPPMKIVASLADVYSPKVITAQFTESEKAKLRELIKQRAYRICTLTWDELI